MAAERRSRRAPALLRVGRFFGVPLYFAPSWVLLATLVTVAYRVTLQNLVHGLSTSTAYIAAFAFAVALALCVLAHELGHTAVSLALHRPVHRVVIFFLGGVSEIEGEISSARDECLVALAGPAVSALITGASFSAALFAGPGTLTRELLILLAWSNLIVTVFNLLPGLPLDGGRALRAGVWAISKRPMTGTRVAVIAGRVIAGLLLLASIALATVHDGLLVSLSTAIVAGYMWSGANRALQAAQIHERIADVHVRDLLRAGIFVHADVSLAEAVRRARQTAARGIVVLDAADRPRAIVEESRVRAVEPSRQPWTPVVSVARDLEPGLTLRDDLCGEDLLEAIRRAPAGEYLVVHPDGSAAGILSAGDVTSRLMGRTR